ncbi:MAG: DUF1573 domain-containing protein [Bacteroidales bacterium]|jgi:hypothetical protein|nr:DUF1573 domain-containing protein [Bacteroidales bacterium]
MMNFKNVLFLLSLILFCSCGNNKNSTGITVEDITNPASADEAHSKDREKLPVITFEKTEHDFGKVTQGERLSYTFHFTNTGKSDLIIENTQSSCGCTTSIPPKAPIRPGEKGEIKVTFDSKNKEGSVSNGVAVMANTYPMYTMVKVTAEVIKRK